MAFEDRLAEAVRHVLLQVRRRDPKSGVWGPIDEILAPRIAAAIEAASLGLNVRALLSEESQDAAVSALRGND
jgi:hypothetical protein